MKKSLLALHIGAVLASFFTKREPEAEAGLKLVEPPEFLYVHVSEADMRLGYTEGWSRDNGHYWLWCNVTRARQRRVACSHSTILTIEAQEMHKAGHKFWLSSDGSYGVREMPAQFIQ